MAVSLVKHTLMDSGEAHAAGGLGAGIDVLWALRRRGGGGGAWEGSRASGAGMMERAHTHAHEYSHTHRGSLAHLPAQP